MIPCLADHCGFTREEMHDALKFKFLRTSSEGEPLLRVRGTSALDTQEFTMLIDLVRGWARRELYCHIPAPNEADLDDAS